MTDKKVQDKSPVKDKPVKAKAKVAKPVKSKDKPEQVEKVKMCKISVTSLKEVCDWLNSDTMPLPQNQIRSALALLMAAELIED